MKQRLLWVIGALCLVIGGVGVFVPVLPTTPFVLVAAGCFSTSPRAIRWLEKNRYFGEYLRCYRSGGGISRKTRVISLVMLWGMLILSAVIVRKVPVALILAVVGTLVTIHIMTIGRKKEN